MYRLLSTMTWPSLLKVGGVADSLFDVVSCKAIPKYALHLVIYIRLRYFNVFSFLLIVDLWLVLLFQATHIVSAEPVARERLVSPSRS